MLRVHQVGTTMTNIQQKCPRCGAEFGHIVPDTSFSPKGKIWCLECIREVLGDGTPRYLFYGKPMLELSQEAQAKQTKSDKVTSKLRWGLKKRG